MARTAIHKPDDKEQEYPVLVYRSPGAYQAEGGTFACLQVCNDGELRAALAEGWHATITEAVRAEK